MGHLFILIRLIESDILPPFFFSNQQTYKNSYFPLPSLALSITKMEQGLVGTISVMALATRYPNGEALESYHKCALIIIKKII